MSGRGPGRGEDIVTAVKPSSVVYYTILCLILVAAIVYGIVVGNWLLFAVATVAGVLAAATFYVRAQGGGRRR